MALTRWAGRLAAFVVVGLGVSSMLPTASAFASAAGPATIYKSDLSGPLDSGGSRTEFAIALPKDASCPGDSAHEFFHVFSFLVPGGTDPSKVSYRDSKPDRGLGLIFGGEYYGAANTALQTGQIVDIPNDFVWSRWTPAELFTGGATSAVWTTGIACADEHGVTARYWSQSVRFTASRSDPGGFVWTTVGGPRTGRSIFRWAVIGPLGVAALLAGAAIGLSRRSRKSTKGAPVGPDPAARGWS